MSSLVSFVQARRLHYGDELYHKYLKNADGSAQRWRVTGMPKTWKTRPGEIRVPLKRGMSEYGVLDQYNLNDFTLREPRVRRRASRRKRGRVGLLGY